MKLTFPLQIPGKDDARVRDKIRHEVNKAVRRARQKEIPEGFGMWAFNCKAGPTADAAEPIELKQIGAQIDALAVAGGTQVYIEIQAVAVARPPRPTLDNP